MRRTPKPEAVQDQWQLISEDDAENQVFVLFGEITERWEPPDASDRPFDYLSPRDRTIALLAHLDVEVLNGGFDQWFHNPTGFFVAEARVAARDLRMDYLADLIRDAEVEYFSQHNAGLPDTERVKSLREFDRQYEEWRPDILRQMLRWWHSTDADAKLPQ